MSASVIEDLGKSVARGSAWLEARLDPAGKFVGAEQELSAYYKSLMAFAMCGRISAGARAAHQVRLELSQDGELASEGGATKTAISRMARNLANYMDGWVAIGAWLLGDYRFAETICIRLEEDQCEEHGGLLTGPSKWSGAARYDLSTAASCGRAFLICGHRAAATAAGDFVVDALDHQSDAATGLDLSFDSRWTIVACPNEEERTYYRFDLTRGGEKVWFPAFSAAYLVELWQVTAEPRYLAAAEEYYGFISRSPEYVAGSIANGKSGWAAGLLASATGKSEYELALDMIVPNVLARQRDDGEFAESPATKAIPQQPSVAASQESPTILGRRLERTAEFTTWAAEFLRHYSARGGAA